MQGSKITLFCRRAHSSWGAVARTTSRRCHCLVDVEIKDAQHMDGKHMDSKSDSPSSTSAGERIFHLLSLQKPCCGRTFVCVETVRSSDCRLTSDADVGRAYLTLCVESAREGEGALDQSHASCLVAVGRVFAHRLVCHSRVTEPSRGNQEQRPFVQLTSQPGAPGPRSTLRASPDARYHDDEDWPREKDLASPALSACRG